jgi:Fe-S-cluster containining protein
MLILFFMPSADDSRMLSSLCKKCAGKCCHGSDFLTVSSAELEALKKIKRIRHGFLSTGVGRIAILRFKNKTCPFLAKNGCLLKGRTRPLGCRLFPLTFLVENKEINFYMSKFCPYNDNALKLSSWIRKTIAVARQELNSWPSEEKESRSCYHKKIHKNHEFLVEIK